MDSSEAMEDYDLMFITDATGSMGRYLRDLQLALPQIFDLVQLTNMIHRISVLAFRDYCDGKLIEWSQWSDVSDTTSLKSFVQNLTAEGGGDTPEAVKTGLWEASKKVERPTICIMYVDAPPHHYYKEQSPGVNYEREVRALGETEAQWFNICQRLRDRQMYVYPMFPNFCDNATYPFYVSLAEFTHGQCLEIGNSSVVRATIGILLNVAGVEFEYDKICSSVTTFGDVNYKEILADGSMYDQKKYHENRPVEIEIIEEIKLRIGNPIAKFQQCEEYRDLVFKVFANLLLPERIMAFTYNTLFGKLWREICKQRKDPRRAALMDKLSHTVTVISDSDRLVLQTFIEDTYDNTDEIEEILQTYGVDGPFYVIDHGKHLPRKTIFEIGQSCAPFAVQLVLQLLTGLRITTQLLNPSFNVSYIPVNLPANLKFKLLPHLIRPGTMFSLRLSAIMASIAKISGSILREDATQFLKEMRGKWIDFELPECNSTDFARLMMQIKDDALTETEVKHFRALLMTSSLKRAKDNQIEVEIAYTSYKNKRPDHKDECKSCGQWRSLTLLLDDTCALCLEDSGRNYLEPKTETESWMCECQKCLVHYAVFNKEQLKCKAKCHFCRLGMVSPFVTCQLCKNKFLYQRSSAPSPDYVCAVCTQQKGRVGQKCNSSVAKYIERNGAGFIGMDIDASTFFSDRNRISKMSAEDRLKAVRFFKNIEETDLANHSFDIGELGKEIWNVKELQQAVLRLFTKPNVGKCMICFEDMPQNKLGPICGLTRNGCSIQACKKCLNSWYNQLAPGSVCEPAQLVCCYCKRVPAIKVVRQYNRQLCTLMNTMDVAAFDPSYIYAWCVKCFVIKQAMRRECGREQQDEIRNFLCADCVTSAHQLAAKECPKCKAATVKDGGCNHIACENVLSDGTSCGAHWCWVCGALSTHSDIYVHLSTVHGGYFSAEDIGDFDEQMPVVEE